MEYMIRIELPDVPGSLAKAASMLAEAGADIQAVEVKASNNGVAIDDVWVNSKEPEKIEKHMNVDEGYKLIHVGASRGLPSVSTIRVASTIKSILKGALSFEQAVVILVGGNMAASSADFIDQVDETYQKNRRIMRIDVEDKQLVVEREYRFLDEEVRTAQELVWLCKEASDTMNKIEVIGGGEYLT